MRLTSSFTLPPPRIGTLSDAARARMNESAAIAPSYRCKPCLRELLELSPEKALARWRKLDASECTCDVLPAILVHIGDRAIVPLLASERLTRESAMDLVEDVGTPWAIPRALEALIGPPRHDYTSGFEEHVRARTWLRRFAKEIEPALRALAEGRKCAQLEPLFAVTRGAHEKGADAPIPIAEQAKMALGTIDPREAVPLRFALSDAKSILEGYARVPEAKFLARLVVPSPVDPFAHWRKARRLDVAEKLKQRWFAVPDDAYVRLAIALAGPPVVEELAKLDWPRDKNAKRRAYREATFPEAAAEVACGMAPADRDRVLAIVGDLATIATKKHAYVRRFAFIGLEHAAALLGEPADSFDERYFPRLGFDASGKRSIASGPRTIDVTLEPDLSISFAVGGTPRKTAPKSAELAELRGRLAPIQLALERKFRSWLRYGQRWTKRDFVERVLPHPLFASISMGMVWGLYDDADDVRATFRVAEDRTFADVDDARIELPDDARIGPVHVAEIDDALVARWQRLLADYEIVPLFEQLVARRTLGRSDDREIRRAFERRFSKYDLERMSTPSGWSRVDSEIGKREKGAQLTWQRAVRRWRVKITATERELVARVRLAGDVRPTWLSFRKLPLVAHEIIGDFERFMARHVER